MTWLRGVIFGKKPGVSGLPYDPRLDQLRQIEAENDARLEMLGLSRQVLEERIESDLAATRRGRHTRAGKAGSDDRVA